jgi:membrane-bound lytic murein transglycosylase MltF
MNMKQLYKISFLLFVLLLIVILIIRLKKKEDDQERDFPQIKSSGVINIVTEYNSVDYYVSGDTLAGLQYELCKYIEMRSGLSTEIFLENNLDVCIKGLENKTYDIIARNIPITNDNKQFLSFTIPITQNKQVLVQRKAEEGDSVPFIRNQIDLANKIVYIPQNSPNILRLRNLSEEIAEPVHIKEVEKYSAEQLIYMVAFREIDYAVVDKELALKNRALFPLIDIETDISFTQLQAWAVRKTSPVLLDSLNNWIAGFKIAHHQSKRERTR